jgi:GAF domain-containing protein
MKCPRCQQENPAHANSCLECGARFIGSQQGGSPTAPDTNRQIAEAVGEQTTTGAVLRDISSPASDVQPVLGAIARTAARLCDAGDALIYLVDGDRHRLVAKYGRVPQPQRIGDSHPIRRDTPLGRAVLDRRQVHVRDIKADRRGRFRGLQALGFHVAGVRTILAMPLLRDGVTVGGFVIRRTRVRPFTTKQIALLKTFADQAVIAIENVRLFTELKEKNSALTEALDQQTATSKILSVISSSPTDVQPVFEAIIQNAVRLCGAIYGTVYKVNGGEIHLVAHHNVTPDQLEQWQQQFPRLVSGSGTFNKAIRTGTVCRTADWEADTEWVASSASVEAFHRAHGIRSLLIVPMFRQREVIGAIGLSHREVGAFTSAHVELLQTFADQAVIAIENVRLFKELEARTHELTRSVGELRALGEVGQAISSTLDLQTVLQTIVARATELAGADAGVIYEYDQQDEIFEPRATERLEAEIVEALIAVPVRKGEGVTGRLADAHEPIQLSDILEAPPESRVRDTLGRAGYRALLAVPLVREDHLLGGLTVFRKTPGEFSLEIIEVLRTFATQSALAIQNARLFQEIADKGRQLEAASKHKSEFLANMSHELRTPLNAIIGFSEVLSERMFGDLNAKQEEYLKDIHASGQHLLSLINDILDLSKIEAGRMELELTDFHLPAALDNALTLVRERAGRRGIALHMTTDERLDYVRADERKVRQVVLNLLSNAIKFTPEGGRIEVRAKPVDGAVEVSVTDTGRDRARGSGGDLRGVPAGWDR